MHSIIWLLLLVLDIWALIRILGSTVDGIKKLIWIILIFIFPFLGVILWVALDGPGAKGKA
jgi:hypothetical protein